MPETDHGYVYDLMIRLGASDFVANTVEFLIVPVKIVLILLAALLLGRLAGRAVRKFVRTGYHRTPVGTPSVRAEQRAHTVGDAAASLARGLIMSVAVLVVLDQLGLNLAPLLAGAGIAGLAIGFGAQSLVRDFLSGFFVLIEDQYGVGDVITLGESTGTVEDVSLRVTRLRSVDGTVWFVPNGEIRRVGNSSMEWSRALLDVQVSYESDIETASVAVLEEANAMYADAQWSDGILEPPELWGVQAIDPNGVTIRLVVKTAPRAQFTIARELRGRIVKRLRQEGVRGPGQPVVVTTGTEPAKPQ